jgi:hypothetical protein
MNWKKLLNERFLLIVISFTFVIYILLNTLVIQPKPVNTDLFTRQINIQKQIIAEQQRNIDSLSKNELRYDVLIQKLNLTIDSNNTTIKQLQKRLWYERTKVDKFTTPDISNFFKDNYGAGN